MTTPRNGNTFADDTLDEVLRQQGLGTHFLFGEIVNEVAGVAAIQIQAFFELRLINSVMSTLRRAV